MILFKKFFLIWQLHIEDLKKTKSNLFRFLIRKFFDQVLYGLWELIVISFSWNSYQTYRKLSWGWFYALLIFIWEITDFYLSVFCNSKKSYFEIISQHFYRLSGYYELRTNSLQMYETFSNSASFEEILTLFHGFLSLKTILRNILVPTYTKLLAIDMEARAFKKWIKYPTLFNWKTGSIKISDPYSQLLSNESISLFYSKQTINSVTKVYLFILVASSVTRISS